MELNKAQKLVKMVELMNRRGGIRATEFMDRFELDPRTLRRYLADLRGLNLPIEDNGTGFDRTIALDPSYRRAGVQLTLPEVLSLHFGRSLFTFLDGTQFAADLDDAIERLAPAIPRAHADVTRDLDRRFIAVPEHAKDYGEIGDIIDEVITSLIYNNPASVEYAKPDGVSRRYDLEPYTLATYRQGLYLFARDRADDRVKTFAIERFVSFSRRRLEKYVIPDDYDPNQLVADCFGIIGGEAIELSAVFDASAAPYVAERRWHHSQHLEVLDDGRLRLTMKVGLSQELVSWLLGFGGAVRVEGPAPLKERLRAAHLEALERLS
ncbi:MAG: transcriptional regulator [Alphaproteobacteria bacterium]|nr:transcriptional regulator [Alphaproteobacteria bacterium]